VTSNRTSTQLIAPVTPPVTPPTAIDPCAEPVDSVATNNGCTNTSNGDGFSNAGGFAVVTYDATAATSTALITYNSTNGNLFYDQNGAAAGFGTGTQFATVSCQVSLTASNFLIV
jgi:Ca2+-binding RTX toxin-like protein